jgi:hypothetical protein
MPFNKCKKCNIEIDIKKSNIHYVFNLCDKCFQQRKNWASSCNKCLYCEGHLVVIGQKRKNGVGNDWDNRYLHLKCKKDISSMKSEFTYLY